MRSTKTTAHRVVGDALGYCDDVEVFELRVRCSCGREQLEKFDADFSLRMQLEGVTCEGCGLLGGMKQVRVPS